MGESVKWLNGGSEICGIASRLLSRHQTCQPVTMLMKSLGRTVAGVWLGLFLAVTAQGAETNQPSVKWEPAILAFEASDKTNPPPKDAVLLIGSSSIRKWTNAAAAFPKYRIINRGFGGSQLA